jgi:YHS domain-containing protein
LGILPHHSLIGHQVPLPGWITVLFDALVVIAGGGLYLFSSHRARQSDTPDEVDNSPFAIDPICGMQVNKAAAPASIQDASGRWVYFCADRCKERFLKNEGPAAMSTIMAEAEPVRIELRRKAAPPKS